MTELDRFIRLPEVLRRTGLSRATIWRRIGRGTFPRAQKIGPNSVAWRESDLREWLAAPMVWEAAA